MNEFNILGFYQPTYSQKGPRNRRSLPLQRLNLAHIFCCFLDGDHYSRLGALLEGEGSGDYAYKFLLNPAFEHRH